MKKRNLFLSLICSIMVTVALATFTVVNFVMPKNETIDTPATNVTDSNQNVSDDSTGGDSDVQKPSEEVEIPAIQNGSAEYPYIIADIESFNKYIKTYGSMSTTEPVLRPVLVPKMIQSLTPEMVPALEPVMVPALEPVLVPEMVPALTEKLVKSYDSEGNLRVDENGDPILVVAYDKDGNVIMTELCDENGEIVYTLKLDENNNVVMTELRDENGEIVYQEVRDENGEIVYTEKLDENGKIVYQEVVDENGEVVLVENIDENGNVIKVPAFDENGDPIMEVEYDENGNVVYTELRDENNNIVYEIEYDENGNIVYMDTCYFKLVKDIDFAGQDFVTLFNQDKPFNGHILGNGYALKNISINVNVSNLNSYIYKNAENRDRYDAYIGIFGKIEDAEIVELKINNISVVVADEVYDYVASGEFFKAHKNNAMNDIKVGTLAAISKNSIVSVDVNGEVKAAAYSLILGNEPQNNSSIGGVVGLSVGTEFSKTNVNVDFVASNNAMDERYFVGGIAGQGYYSKVVESNIDFDVKTTYTKPINIGGVFGYMVDVELSNSNIKLDVSESVARGTFDNFANKGYDHTTSTWIGGIASIMKAEDGEIINVENVNVVANVNIDAVYAGVVVEVSSLSVEGNVNFKNVNVNSNVDVLEAFGFARYLGVATISYDAEEFEVDENNNKYNVKLTGNVILKNIEDKNSVAASVFEKDFMIAGKGSDLKVIISENMLNKLTIAEKLTVERLENLVLC